MNQHPETHVNTLPRTLRSPLVRRLLGAAGCALLMASGLAQAQVTVFDKVPSPDEIKRALSEHAAPKPSAPPLAGAPHTRSIEWNRPPTTASAKAVAEAPPANPAVALPVTFTVGTSKVSPGSMAYIEAIAGALISDPNLHVVIEGHTDAAGRPQQNLMLSWERAFAVYRLLVEKYGIDPERLQPQGKGSSEPLDVNLPLDPRNRRVQFRVVG